MIRKLKKWINPNILIGIGNLCLFLNMKRGHRYAIKSLGIKFGKTKLNQYNQINGLHLPLFKYLKNSFQYINLLTNLTG